MSIVTTASTETIQQSPIQEQSIPEKTPTPPVEEKKDVFSQQFASLARKEKMIRDQARKIEEEKRALKLRESEIANSVHSEWKSKLSQNPWDTLIEAGLTPDQVTQVMLNQPKPEELEMRKIKQELETLKNAQAQSLEDLKKQQSERYNQVKNQVAMDVRMLSKNEPHEYEALRSFGSYGENEVMELIEEVHDNGIPGVYEKGYIMSVEEAAQEVENILVEKVLELAKMKKVRDKLGLVDDLSSQKQPNLQKPPFNTLSNRVTPPTRPLSEKERRERAILAFQGKV